MPSVNSRSMPNVWPSSTFTTPSLPTFSMASAITSPLSSSPAAIVATRAKGRLGEDGRRRRAVAGHVVGRRGDLADELRALVLEDVLDLDLTSDGHAVVGDGGGAELLVED